MTRKEAIEVIKDIYNYTKWDTYTVNEARTMAIEALEREHCEDCVSRQAVLDTLDTADKFLDEDRTVERYKAILTESYEVLPSVNSQEPKIGHWINMSISTSGDASMECSLCGCRVHNSFTQNLINYCPNCGSYNGGTE